MKKRRLAALALLAPFALLLTGCGGLTPLNLSANWYFNTAEGRENIVGTYEELEYKVTFEPAKATAEYTVVYNPGTYKTTLADDTFTLEDGSKVAAYHYHTEYEITGYFLYKGVPGANFTDTSTADVWFMSVRDELRPLKSEKEIHNSVPVATPSATHLSDVWNYKYTVEYSSDMKRAKYTYVNLDDEGTLERNIKISGSGTYLDNEIIYLALRGLDMGGKVSFRSIDPQRLATMQLSVSPAAEKDKVNFERTIVGGETTTVNAEIDTAHVSLAYNTAQPGPTRSIIYAKKTSADGNLYRNVPVEIKNPIMHALGDMRYTLTRATFNTK